MTLGRIHLKRISYWKRVAWVTALFSAALMGLLLLLVALAQPGVDGQFRPTFGPFVYALFPLAVVTGLSIFVRVQTRLNTRRGL
ncbi:MAG: hypothetical protein AAFO73_07590 [Pseudomonadota bacterium]